MRLISIASPEFGVPGIPSIILLLERFVSGACINREIVEFYVDVGGRRKRC